ncbi:MAG: hypothetical protein QMC37_00180 [Flavobacteriales bacterium]
MPETRQSIIYLILLHKRTYQGVQGVSSDASVDPIAEMTIPGIDSSAMNTFEI